MDKLTASKATVFLAAVTLNRSRKTPGDPPMLSPVFLDHACCALGVCSVVVHKRELTALAIFRHKRAWFWRLKNVVFFIYIKMKWPYFSICEVGLKPFLRGDFYSNLSAGKESSSQPPPPQKKQQQQTNKTKNQQNSAMRLLLLERV